MLVATDQSESSTPAVAALALLFCFSQALQIKERLLLKLWKHVYPQRYFLKSSPFIIGIPADDLECFTLM